MPKTTHSKVASTTRGRIAQGESQTTCSGIDARTPPMTSTVNHEDGTHHPRRAAAAMRNRPPDAMPSSGVRVFNASPGGINVRVSVKKGHSTPPPTHHGGGP